MEPWLEVRPELDAVEELCDDLDDLIDIVLMDEPSRDDLVDEPFIDEALEEADFLEWGDDLPETAVADFLNDLRDEFDLTDEDLLDMDDDDLSDDWEPNLPDLLDEAEPGIDVDLWLVDAGRINDVSPKCLLNECWDVGLMCKLMFV